MPVTHVTHDLDSRTLTIVADFAAPVERVWQVYADAAQLAQVWGPPTYPATFVRHELTPGGEMHYFMTSPEGERFYGLWRVLTVDEPHQFTFEDAFADENFAVAETLPVSHNTYAFAEHEGGTRATYTGVYPSAEALQQVLEMGMVEGATLSLNQIDALLAG
ncbi:MAG: SRPBCC domain-containing protein [Propioniciclava sp.]|uniref:SRPBCC family protein n=1 Tax=Propioniciclava sp. TaxID=2038686 RepID=UPI0039E59722